MSVSRNTRGRPWFKLHAVDFLADPAVDWLDADQRRRYLMALLLSWLTESPGVGTEEDWCHFCGYSQDQWVQNREFLKRCFKIDDAGTWKQKRLMEMYDQATAKSRAGKRGSEARWGAVCQCDRIEKDGLPMRSQCRGKSKDSSEASSEASWVGGYVSSLEASYARAREGGQNGRGGEADGEGAGDGDGGDVGREELGAGDAPAGVAGAGGPNGPGGTAAGTGGGDADVEDPAGGAAPRSLRRRAAPDPGAADAKAARAEWAAAFEEFYAVYPRKVAPSDARKAWMKIEPKTQEMFDLIDAGLMRHVEVWKTRERDKIPHPTTWINKRRWEGEA